MINDNGFTIILFLILTIYNVVNKQLGESRSEVYINYFIFFILYKSLAVYDEGINFQYIFKKEKDKDIYKNYYNKKYKYIDFLFKFKSNIRNKLKEFLDEKNIFLYTDYINYLDWLTGSIQHIIMGKIIEKQQKKPTLNIKKIKFLFTLEVLYDLCNIIDI